MLVLIALFCGAATSGDVYAQTTRYQAESCNLANASTATAVSGYDGSAYVTGLISEWSKISFERSYSTLTPVTLSIRYNNPTGSAVSNLALYQGSNKIQDVTFPTTAANTWATSSFSFSVQPGYQAVSLQGTSSSSASVNVDYFDLSIGSAVAVTGVSVSPATASVATGATRQLTASVSPSNATNTAVSWSSANAAIATVSNSGLVTGISAGTTTITATTADGSKTAACTVTVTNGSTVAVTGVNLSPASLSLVASATGTLTATLSPANATNQALAWSSSNTSIATVNSSGIVTGVAAGSATITVTTADGGKTASSAITVTAPSGPPSPGTATRYEAETSNIGNATTSSVGGGYSGTGYVRGLTSQWSKVAFERSYNDPTLVRVDIRYANPTGSNVTNLALYQGSAKVQDLSFPPTANGSTWATLPVTFSMPAGYQGIALQGTADAGNSIYVDYFDLTTGVPPPASGAFSQTAPAAGATNVSSLPAFSWGTAANAASYSLVVSTSSSYASPVINVAGISGTSYQATTALAASTTYYWRVTAVNTGGSTVATNAGSSFTTAAPPPAPGTFAQTSPAAGATGVAQSATFGWGAASNAASYSLIVSTNSSFTNPVVNQSGITATSYTVPASLALATTYYWRVTAVNATGTTVATNAGLSFTTTATAPVGGNGLLTREVWSGIAGSAVSALTNNANYPNNPTTTGTLTGFDAPRNVADSYGQRIRGYITAPVTGAYAFWIASDDDSKLFLSTNNLSSNKVEIASVTGWTNPLQFDKYSSQTSASINLVAGTQYYIEALHKDADGGDHLTVAWRKPGGTQEIIPGSVLSSVPAVPLPLPNAFTQTTPANNATGVNRFPEFAWATSSNAASYSLVVSTSSSYASPVINQVGLTNTNYTPSAPLATSTKYYWRVTAVNEGGVTVATNAGISFTTMALPLPGALTQTSPAGGSTGVTTNPAFSWTASVEAASYSLVVSTSSSYASPVINQTGISGTSYSPSSPLATNTTYYWRVTAVNGSGSTVATNAGVSFTTSTTANTLYISTTGSNTTGNGSQGNPWRTLAYACSQATAGKTIYINAGTYVETQPSLVPIGVNITGAGESTTILKAGNLGNGTGKEDFVGSLIQLVSPSYVVDQFSAPIAPANGNQTLSGFTIDGSGKTLKAGIWLQARNNVSIHHITIKDCALRGAVACFGPKRSKEEPPYYITGLKMSDLTFLNSGADLSDESTGNLCVGHTDGAEIYNITINDTYGYGIKFIFEGYYKNTKIHDCQVTVNEQDPLWTEDIIMELWNLGAGNEVYNVKGNTWMSFVNWANTFNNPTTAGSNLKIHDCQIIDLDGSSSKEGIEVACSGTEVSNCYFQNKGWGIALWLQAERKITIRNNIFYNTQPQAVWSDAGGVFIAADEVPKMEDIRIYNNVFDNLKTGGNSPLKVVSVWKGTVQGLDVANNVSTNLLAATYDLYLYPAATVSGVTYRNNLRDMAHNTFGPAIASTGNVVNTTPGFKLSGQRQETYYQPASSSSFVVDKGVNVGLPYQGAAPDLGRWEFAGAATPLAAPGTFAQTSPANTATGVAPLTSFSWGSASNAASYNLVVSTSSGLTNPVISQVGLSGTSYTTTVALASGTRYYWRVTAVNATGSTVASNTGISFTTAAPQPPAAFIQTAPAAGATGVSSSPGFVWAAAAGADSYTLVVSASSSYANPVINQAGITSTNYTPSAPLAANTTYYWRVTAVNASGSTVASNAGLSFTTATAPPSGSTYYVALSGSDASGNGTSGSPWRTIAYAASQVTAGTGKTISIGAGTFVETQAIKLATGVSLKGAGQTSTTITSGGPIPAPGVDQTSGDWKLWYDGSLIQLISNTYPAPNPKYGSPTEMLPSVDGNQTLSDFTIDGNSKQIKAGVWVNNRNGVSMHHVTVKNCQQRGAVFGKGDMWWYEPLPEGKWMSNTTVYNCTFQNNGAQLGSETLGNLCIAGLDGADIYNINITDDVGYGIKFIYVGHFRNVKIHDCNISVNEADAAWGEKISIEMWNQSYGNQVYNIVCNTWLSFVNHPQLFAAYDPVGTATSNLKIRNVRMIDSDGVSSKEAIEAAHSGIEISDCYIQDKGFGIAVWYGTGGGSNLKNITIRNNVIANVNRNPGFGFGNSSGVFVPDATNNIKIYNNVFDRMGNGLQLTSANGVEVKNNVFLNCEGADVEGGSNVTFTNNLKYHTNPQKTAWNVGGIAVNATNLFGQPGFINAGDRYGDFYKPASASSLVVNKGTDVGLPFSGSAPDIGRWEYTGATSRMAASQPAPEVVEAALTLHPNPTGGLVQLQLSPDVRVKSIELTDLRGSVLLKQTADLWPGRQLDLSRYPNGVYLVRIRHEKGVMVGKVIVAK